MKLLFLAALRNRKHYFLAVLTMVTLLFLTFSEQLERVSLGVLANSGADFFQMFSDSRENDLVNYSTMERRWKKIDKKNNGYITKKDAKKYLATHSQNNMLKSILYKASSILDFEENFLGLIIFLIVVAILKAVTLFSSRYTTQILSIRVTRDLRQQYFEHIQSLPMSFYHEYNIGSLTSRAVGDAGQIASSLNSCITNYLHTPFTIVTTLFACFYLSWQLSSVIFIGLPLIVFPVVFLTKRIKRVTRQMLKNQENFTSVLLDFFSGIHTIKVFAMEQFSLKKYEEQNNRMAYLESKNAKYSLLTRPVLHTITTFCLAFVVLFGLYTLHMTVAQLLMFCGLLHLFYEPVKKFAEENANIQRGIVSAERMFDVLNIESDIKDQDGAIELDGFNDAIEFDNISFKYKKHWVLKDLSFTVKKGQTVAIVGPTGAGKSTIIQLLSRLYDVQAGDIKIDGTSIKTYTQKSLREHISVVPQRPFLFYDTVSENIAFGKSFTKEEIESAAKKAYAHEFVVNLPEGYDTVLAEAGKSLSGGQQQRLTIARALVKKAPILVMDEATSSLDAISENRIKKAISELHKEYTQIIIAHRLSTIENADKIIYLDNGMKIAEGTKDELLERSASFREMWNHFHKINDTKIQKV